MVNNAVLPVKVIPAYRHQSTWSVSPVYGELTEARVAAMRTGRLTWIAQTGLSPVRTEGGPWWSYSSDYQPAYLTSAPTLPADWQDLADSFALAASGSHAGGTFVARFTSSARNTIIIEDVSAILIGTLVNAGTTHIDISTDSGVSYVSLGYTTIVDGNTITLTKTTGNWLSVVDGAMRVRYGYGFPLFLPTYPTAASAIVLQNYYRSKQGVLFETSAQYPFRQFDLAVVPFVGDAGAGLRRLPLLGVGK